MSNILVHTNNNFFETSKIIILHIWHFTIMSANRVSFYFRTDDPSKLYEKLISLYEKLCSDTFSAGILDDELPPRLPINVLQQNVVPILQHLAVECQKLKLLQLEIKSNSLISINEAIHGTSFKLDSGHTSTSGPMSLASSTSIDDMKLKMGKLFNNWKK